MCVSKNVEAADDSESTCISIDSFINVQIYSWTIVWLVDMAVYNIYKSSRETPKSSQYLLSAVKLPASTQKWLYEQ